MTVDYDESTSPNIVFRRFAETYLEATDDTSLLHYAQLHDVEAHPEVDGFPPWIPRWGSYLSDAVIYTPMDQIIFPDSPPNSALPPKVLGNILAVRGIIMDTILFTSSPFSEYPTINGIKDVWEKVKRLQTRTVYKSSSPVQEFYQAITCGRPARLDRDKAWEETLLHGLGQDDDDRDPSAGSEPQQLSQRTVNRKLAISRRGYYCSVPSEARGDDVFAIIYGTKTPFCGGWRTAAIR